MKIGHGYDVHQFTDGNKVTLAGIEIPYEKGILAHSDGDVIIHALCDAMLGALALGDIGHYFPDTDKKYKTIPSKYFLEQCMDLLREKQCSVGNLDVTLIAQAPKIAPHIRVMRENLANIMQIHIEKINIKATTTEHLGFIGRKEGIACHVVVLLK